MSSANTVRQILPPGAEDLSLFALTALLLWRYATLFFSAAARRFEHGHADLRRQHAGGD